MPLSIVLIIVGILLVCAAYYLTMPPPVHGLCMFLGVAAILIGVALLVWDLLAGAGGFKLAMVLMGGT